MKFELVAFDADQTLFDFRSTMMNALREVCIYLSAEAGVDVNAAELKEVRDEISFRHRNKAMDMLDLRKLSFREVLGSCKEPDRHVDAALEIFLKERFSEPIYYPTVLDTLTIVAARYPTALLTNGNSDPEKANIGHLFDHVVLGQDYSFKKPDPRIFRELLANFEITDLSNVLFVGDSLYNDVHGANQMGFQSVWFNPSLHKNTTAYRPNYEIRSMSELLRVLQIEA